jgi:ribose 5-phosphate isomerase A
MSDQFKKQAAEAAMEHIEDGMRLGLGTGSTAAHFVRALGQAVAGGLNVVGVPTSEETAELAESLHIPLTSLDETPELDVTVDGADEIGPDLVLVKGGGGALLREKIVAAASGRMIVIADRSKHVEMLGAFPLPMEVIEFGLTSTRNAIERAAADLGLAGEISVRSPNGQPFRTDSGNLILDASFGRIPDPKALAERLNRIPGLVEHGLFIDLAALVIISGPDGTEQIRA